MANSVKLCKALGNFRIGAGVVTGVAADTNLAMAGIKTTDELIAVWAYHDTTGVMTDHTGTSTITSDGNVQSTVTTATHKVSVMWASKE